jgi:hypothetical protein
MESLTSKPELENSLDPFRTFNKFVENLPPPNWTHAQRFSWSTDRMLDGLVKSKLTTIFAANADSLSRFPMFANCLIVLPSASTIRNRTASSV